MDLKSYIGRRLILLIPTAIGAVLILFFLYSRLSPRELAFAFARSTKEFQNLPAIIDKYNLDAPFHIQFYQWITNLLKGNLGWSQVYGGSVWEAFRTRLPATLELFLFAAPITIWASIKMGVKSAVNHNKVVDHITRVVSIIGRAMPNFWLGLLLLWVFYGIFSGLFPPGRLSSSVNTYVHTAAFVRYTHINTIDAILNLDLRVLLDALRHLILPVTTLVVSNWALITRITRSSMLDVMKRGYVTTARSKGLSEDKVIYKHARRNALLPVLTVSGYLVIGLILGAFITETIFNIPGVGQFFVRAATQNDYAAVTGFTFIFALIIIIVNLLVDVLYAYMDPRVRLG